MIGGRRWSAADDDRRATMTDNRRLAIDDDQRLAMMVTIGDDDDDRRWLATGDDWLPMTTVMTSGDDDNWQPTIDDDDNLHPMTDGLRLAMTYDRRRRWWPMTCDGQPTTEGGRQPTATKSSRRSMRGKRSVVTNGRWPPTIGRGEGDRKRSTRVFIYIRIKKIS